MLRIPCVMRAWLLVLCLCLSVVFWSLSELSPFTKYHRNQRSKRTHLRLNHHYFMRYATNIHEGMTFLTALAYHIDRPFLSFPFLWPGPAICWGILNGSDRDPDGTNAFPNHYHRNLLLPVLYPSSSETIYRLLLI